MNIKTITCHDVYNYGASLQAFALQHYLESLGHDVQIIDYKPDYLTRGNSLTSVQNSKYDRPILKQLYILAKLPDRLLGLKHKRSFDNFTSMYLHLTQRYNSYEELKADAPNADVYIAGSDQIWNTIFPNGRDRAFYLDFGNSEIRRISYAASFATREIVPEYREFVKRELKNLDACSIRERSSLKLLKTLGCEDGVAVCDPVFLLRKHEWIDVLCKSSTNSNTDYLSEKYILVYLTDKSEQIKNIALEVKKKTDWKIYVLSIRKEQYADRNIVNAGPFDFIELIRNSQFVISNSFHATAFSLIFEKKFCVVNRNEGINERMKSVLEDFGLEERLTSQFYDKLLDDIDYNKVRIPKENIVQFSKGWLNSSLATK